MGSPIKAFVTEFKRDDFKYDVALRQRLQDFMKRYDWNVQQVSRDLQRFCGRSKGANGKAQNTGLGYSTVYNYAVMKWAPNSSQERLELFEKRLLSWLDHREQGGKVSEIDEDVTSAKLIQAGLAEAHESRKFVGIVGPSGMGKSLLTRYYTNKNSRGGIVVIEAYDGMTAVAFLSAVCRALGDVDTGSKDALINRVASILADQPRTLAIDEANFLKEESINHLVYIWNQNNVGVVLLGTDELERTLRSSKLQRVHSRLKLIIQLDRLNDQEIRRRLEESFEESEITARVIEIAKVGSFGRYRDLDTLIDTVSQKRDHYADKSLEWLFERFSSRTDGNRKKR